MPDDFSPLQVDRDGDLALRLNPQRLNGLRALERSAGAGFVARLLKTYLQSLDSGQAQAEAAIAQQRWTELTELAHALKSSSASLGADAFAAQSVRIEALGRRGELTALSQALLTDWLAGFERTRQAVHQVLREGPT